MTGTIEFQALITSIRYEMKTVLRDTTLSLYYKIVFCIFKIVCVCGFALGREFPEKRNRAPLAPPSTPNLFSSLETRHDEETMELLTSDDAHEEVGSNDRPLEAPTADTSFHQELTVESVAAVELSEFRPTVVIVAPIYVKTLQQQRELMELITSLANQIYKAAQIILVDDSSPLPWYKISATGESNEDIVKLPKNTRLVRRPKNQGPASARTLGLGIAITEHQAQIVNFIDSDCEADSHWVEAMVMAHYHELKKKPERSGHGAILSGLTYAYESSNVGKFHDHFGTLNGRVKMNGDGLLYGPSCNLSIRISKKLIYEVGGFDESFPKAAFEDVDFCLRANRCGISTQCAQNAKVWHKYSDSIFRLFRMFQRYGASEWAVIENHPLYMNMYGASYHIPSRTPKVVT